MRELTRRLEALEAKIRAERNALGQLPERSPVRASHARVVALLEDERDALEGELEALFARDEELARRDELARSIPGVGPKTARVTVAEMGELERFESAEDVTAWAGLVPRQHRSGTSIARAARIARGGCSRARRVLYMAAYGGGERAADQGVGAVGGAPEGEGEGGQEAGGGDDG